MWEEIASETGICGDPCSGQRSRRGIEAAKRLERKAAAPWNSSAHWAFAERYTRFRARAQGPDGGTRNFQRARRDGIGFESDGLGARGGSSVTRPAKPSDPLVRAGGVMMYDIFAVRKGFRSGSPEADKRAGAADGPRLRQRQPKQDYIADQTAQQLRCIYHDVLKQPIPDRFVDLLRELESKPASQGGKKDEGKDSA